MSRVCESSGKRPRKGGNIVYHGIPKYLGGIGLHVRGRSKRRFKPNLQEVRVALPNGEIRKMKLATSELRNGVINATVSGTNTAPASSQLVWPQGVILAIHTLASPGHVVPLTAPPRPAAQSTSSLAVAMRERVEPSQPGQARPVRLARQNPASTVTSGSQWRQAAPTSPSTSIGVMRFLLGATS